MIDNLSYEDAKRELKRICGEFEYERGRLLVIDNILTENECQYIVEQITNHQNLKDIRHLKDDKLGYGVREGKSYRLDDVHFKELDTLIYEKVAKKIYSILSRNDYYSIWINRYSISDLGYEYCYYTSGQKLITHTDSHFLKYGAVNPFNIETEIHYIPYIIASMSLHLNTLEQGGELVFPKQNITIQQKAGRIVIWSPDHMFEHGTNPVSDGDVRHNIVTWYAIEDLVGVQVQDLIKIK